MLEVVGCDVVEDAVCATMLRWGGCGRSTLCLRSQGHREMMSLGTPMFARIFRFVVQQKTAIASLYS